MNELIVTDIKRRIHTIRGMQVIVDSDIANLYNVPVKALNQAVKRNSERFPESFMFQLTEKEVEILRSQIVTSSSEWGGRRYLPYVFTEQGVSMLSGVLKSKTAIQVSINIMNAFVAMRKFIAQNASVFQRLDRVELKQLEHDDKFEKVFKALETSEKKQGIFYDGQVFDAYVFVCDLVKEAKKQIVLIDNYVDESVLTFFSKRKKGVSVHIYTKTISKQLKLDVEKFNAQHEPILVKQFNNSHDRFLIIDSKEVYHFGASLKDLGKKWFAFSKFEKEAIDMLSKLNGVK
ncbi:ORF6N domain-containing protein [Candidatus Woesearchaeota archaeon]|nr:ORF6N domain-containing protein [Candidatus Woesearchaeota archaeon]